VDVADFMLIRPNKSGTDGDKNPGRRTGTYNMTRWTTRVTTICRANSLPSIKLLSFQLLRITSCGLHVGSLFNDAFSVTRLYSADDRMISE
jgi:hypothetical protein